MLIDKYHQVQLLFFVTALPLMNDALRKCQVSDQEVSFIISVNEKTLLCC